MLAFEPLDKRLAAFHHVGMTDNPPGIQIGQPELDLLVFPLLVGDFFRLHCLGFLRGVPFPEERVEQRVYVTR